MTSILVAAAILVLGGAAPALATVGFQVRALPLAPLITALVVSGAGLAALATRSSIAPWAALGLLAVNVVAARRLRSNRPTREPRSRAVGAALVLAVAGYPFLGLQAPDAGWDARLIFFLHARWFYAGGGYLASALRNPAYLFAHPDYPPLIPATVGSLWRVAGHIDMRMAQAAVTILNVATVALVGLAIARLRSAPWLATIVGGAVCLAAYGFAGNYTTDGYADLLWAAAATAALLYLLVLPADPTDVVIGLMCAGAAALTKNEGIPVVATILVLAALRHRPRPTARWVATVAALTVAVFGWPVLALVTGARSDLFGGGHSGGPLAATRDTWARVRPAWHSVWIWCRGDLRLGAVALGTGWLGGSRWRRRIGLGSPLWSVTAIVATLVALLGGYTASPYDLAWHMGTSLDRTSIAPRLELIAVVGCWALGTLSSFRDPGGADVRAVAGADRLRWRSDVRRITQRWRAAEGSL